MGLSIHPLPPLLHNHPERIAGQVEELLDRIEPPTLIAYSDCGTYGVGRVCERRGVRRLPGARYDVHAGSDVVEQIMQAEPGTYLVTDFVRGFHRTVISNSAWTAT